MSDQAPVIPHEIWKTTTDGVVWLNVKDPRNPGGWRQQKVGGKGSKRITLSAEEREFNQELIPFENAHLDPFQNGLLVRMNAEERGENEYTDEQLKEMLAVEDEPLFTEQVEAITSEVVLRRLLALAEKIAPLPRLEFVRGVVDARYRVGRTSRVVKEIYEDDERYAAADL